MAEGILQDPRLTRCPSWGAMGSSLPADAVNDYKLELVM